MYTKHKAQTDVTIEKTKNSETMEGDDGRGGPAETGYKKRRYR
jgi:hypothetical protein